MGWASGEILNIKILLIIAGLLLVFLQVPVPLPVERDHALRFMRIIVLPNWRIHIQRGLYMAVQQSHDGNNP